ncbi:MAG TPA: BatD family protein [Longimicrobiales bacterium]|nr:BatD family protein [Longimicrobiales bacterium]
MIQFLFATLLVLQGQDRPVVTAELDPPEGRVGETVVLRISVQVRGSESPRIPVPVLPPSLEIVGTSDYTEVNISVGRRTTTTRRDILLLPQQTGEFRIPPIRITVGGTTAYTWPLTLRVTGSAVTPGAAPAGDARLLVSMVPETVYVGQQSTLVGEVLFSPELQMRLTRPPSYDAPAPSDFWVQELPADAGTGFRVLDEQRYIAQRFYRAYFPLTPGRYAFAPARVTYEARQGFLFAPQTHELRSESPRLTVLPLPDSGKPANFGGAVGDLTVRASIEPLRAAVGDAVSLVVEVKGDGNIKALPPPALPPIDGADVLDPSQSAEIDDRGRTVSGTKRFTWVLVPERPGELHIPRIDYPVFDPTDRVYRTESTDSLALTVLPAARAAPRTVSLRLQPAQPRLAFVRSPAFLAAQFAPLVLLAMGVMVRRRRAGLSPRILRDWQQRLTAARVQGVVGLTAGEQLLRDALAQFARSPVFRSGSPDAVTGALQGILSPEINQSIRELLGRLEAARYAPGGTTLEEARAIFEGLHDVLEPLWRELRAHTRASTVLPAALLALQLASPFQDGSAAFEDKRYPEAVRAFQHYVAAEPNDAAGWFNLGIAHQANRQPAHAAWALLHALKLEPRSATTRTQLARLGVVSLANRVRSVTTLTRNEIILVCTELWWLAALLLAYAIARRKRWAAVAGGGLLALAGLLIVLASVERLLPPAALVLDDGATLLAGKSLHADAIRQLQPLAAVTVVEETDDWLRVRTPDGDVGWVVANAIGRL